MNKKHNVLVTASAIATLAIGTFALRANAAHLKPIPAAAPVAETGDDLNDVGFLSSHNQTSQTPLPQLEYYGGPVVSHLKLQVVLWGSGVNSAVKSQIDRFFSALVDSTYFDFMNGQYNTLFSSLNGYPGTKQQINRGHYLGQKIITPLNRNALINDSATQYQIAAEINHQIKIGALPANDADTDYVIFLPPNVNVTAEFGTGVTDWCAYHGAAPQPQGKFLQYAVMPDLNSPLGFTNCVNSYGKGKLFKAVSFETSAMVAAGVTDPHVAPAGTPNGGQPPETWIASDGETEIYASCSYPNLSYAHLKTAGQGYLVSPLFSRSNLTCTTIDFFAH